MFHEVNPMLNSQLEAKPKPPEKLRDLKMYTNMLQQENLTLKSQLDIKQRRLEKSKDVKVLTSLQEDCSRLKSQLQNQVKYTENIKAQASVLEERNSKLVTQLSARNKIISKGVDKVQTNILQNQYSELESQLKVAQERLKKLEVEKEHYINKYSELKDKERHDIAIQTDMVCPEK